MAIGEGYPILRDHAVRTNRNRSGRSSRPCRGAASGGLRSEVEKLQRYPEEAGFRHRPEPDRIQVFEQARYVDIAGA